MKEIILHIGAHKTGSTALQNYLATNRDILGKKGIVYPSLGDSDVYHHVLLRPIVEPKADDFIWDINRKCSIETREDIKQLMSDYLNSSNESKVVLSTEFLFVNNPIFNNIPVGFDFAEYASDIFSGFTVTPVVYLRNPVDWIESCYGEAVKGAHTCYQGSFDQYLDENRNSLNYQRYLAPWLKVYGDQVKVFCYEKILAEYDGIISHFMCEVLGLDHLDLHETVMNNDRNPSLSKEFLSLLVQFNKLNAERDRKERYFFPFEMKEILNEKWYGKGVYLNQSQARDLIESSGLRVDDDHAQPTYAEYQRLWLSLVMQRPDSIAGINYDGVACIYIKQLTNINQIKKRIEQELSDCSISMYRYKSELDELVVRSDGYIDEIKRLVALCDSFRDENRELNEEIRSLVFRCDSFRDENRVLNEEIRSLVSRCDSFRDENRVLHKACTSYESRCLAYDEKILSLSSSVVESERKISDLSQNNESLRLHINSIKKNPLLYFSKSLYGKIFN